MGPSEREDAHGSATVQGGQVRVMNSRLRAQFTSGVASLGPPAPPALPIITNPENSGLFIWFH